MALNVPKPLSCRCVVWCVCCYVYFISVKKDEVGIGADYSWGPLVICQGTGSIK